MMSRFIKLIPLVLLFLLILPLTSFAATKGESNLSQIETYVDQALSMAKAGQLSQAKKQYQQFKTKWLKIEDTVKPESAKAYQDIESNMGQVDYAFIQKKQKAVISGLIALKDVNSRFINGHYKTGTSFKQQNIQLSDFINMLHDAKAKTDAKDQVAALKEIKQVRQSWLSVEGKVVSKSSKLYNESERDMVIINAMIQNKDYHKASQRLDSMIQYLSPLAQEKGYSIWDAAMIPIREGLEALLVVGALLAFVNKTNEGKGRGWIWSGVIGGVSISAILAVIVKFVFSSGAFGNNNFLIAGVTGLFAAVMLLYMSYWLHSKSNIAEWNQYIKSKSQTALTSGSMVSLGLLSFLAVFREGTETVLFIIGMANQISVQKLLLGLMIGLGVLMVIAFLMFGIGMKLPIRPFFIVSSLIVFYLSVKFLGLGIHSLQLAGMIPTTLSEHLPSVDFIAFFPTWQSAVPQIALFVIAIAVFTWKRLQKKRAKRIRAMSPSFNESIK